MTLSRRTVTAGRFGGGYGPDGEEVVVELVLAVAGALACGLVLLAALLSDASIG